MTAHGISLPRFRRGKVVIGLITLASLQICLVSLSPAGLLSQRAEGAPGLAQGASNHPSANTPGVQPRTDGGHLHPLAQTAAPSALNFDGSNYVEVANSPSLHAPAPITIEAWIKPTAVSGERHIIGKRTYALGVIPLGSGFQVSFTFVSGGSARSVKSGEFALGQWYHVMGDYDGSNMRLFVNGRKAGAIVTSGAIDQASTPLRIGSADDGADDFFSGVIDEVRLSDIIRYRGNGPGIGFVAPQTPFTPDAHTRGLWHLDEGSGTTTADASGNRNTGTLVKSPAWTRDSPFGEPDTTPPDISAIDASTLTTTTATITWTTDEPATSQIEYGTSTAYGSSTAADAALVTSHSQKISGLTATTAYNFQIMSNDAAGNQAISANTTFTTPATDPPPIPTISGLGAGSITPSSATITWAMDVPADSQIEYGTTTAYGMTTPVDPTLVTNHSFTITGLMPETEYHYRIKSRSQDGVVATSGDAVLVSGSATSATAGQWSPVMSWPLVDVHMALLPTGNIVMWDAWETNGTASARLWNPTTQAFTGVSNRFSSIFCAGHAMLADGRQLVVGGYVADDTGIKDVNIFDPATSSWTRVADMNYARWYPTATTLSDGRVLVLGGEITPGVIADIPEVYNPATNTWTQLTGARLNVGEYPNAFLMPNGKVFVVVASDNMSHILDVNTQTWAVVGPAAIPSATSLMYLPGKIAATGGNNTVDKLTAVIDLNQPSPAWRQTASMAYPRFQQNLVQLPDGTVFVLGGANVYSLSATTGILPTELWNPTTETWATMASLQELRMYHSTALLLPDGRVLAAGGGRLSPAVDHLTAEIYSPPYLFNGPRPTISSAPSATNYGANMTVQTPDAASITSVSFIRLSSVTHGFNMDQRYIDLSFTTAGNALTVQSPASANIAPPGYYMLFIKNASGVPSVANIVQIGTPAQADTTPPTVSVTAPANGATVSGAAVTLSATASDNVGVTSVQFLLDGNPLGAPVTTAPYMMTWDTTAATNGSHTLGAQARDAAGNVGTASTISVTVSNAAGTNPPVISAVASSNVQSASATITWTTDKAATSQVDYGTTTAYGLSTTLDPTLVTSHSQALGGLTASTTYHYQVRSADAGGHTATSGDFTFTTAAAGPTWLVGDQTLENQQDNNPAGMAEAFQYTAGTSGNVDKLFVYIDGNNTATQVIVGLYANTRDDNPANLLAQGTISNPAKGAWNSVSVPPAGVTAGTKYWIAVLGPTGAGTVQFRDSATGGKAQTSAQTNLSLLPATWSPGGSYNNSPLSAYAVQSNSTPPDATPPTVSLTAPANGATVSGSAVTVSATASDNVGVTSVQFTLDNNPLGSPVTTAPYSMTWNTTTATNGTHTLGAQAKDAANNLGTAAAVTVTVANAPPDTTPPTVSLTAPANGATVSGASVTLSATASDNVGVASVQFLLDGNSLGAPDTAAPYSLSWDSTKTTNGSHTLGAQAKDAAGNVGTATTVTVTVANPPVISAVSAAAITPSTATIQWTTSSPATSQVDYGTSTAYGASTTLDATLVTNHSQPLSGLTAATTYHFRVRSTDAQGNTATSPDASFSTAPLSPTTLVGDTAIEAQGDNNPAGTAEAFLFTATASGTATKLFVYLDSNNTATQVVVGLYTNATGTNPGTLLAQGTIANPTKGAWNSVTVTGVTVTSGTSYWIAVLGPTGTGTVQFRDKAVGGKAQTSAQTNLTTLPATWTAGATYANSPFSAYAST